MANRPDDADHHPQGQQAGHHQVRAHHGEIEVADVKQPPLSVTLNLPRLGKIIVTRVGSTRWKASTIS